MRQYRQGDVFLQEITEEEFNRLRRQYEKQTEDGVLALGEATGHSHVIDTRASVIFVDPMEQMTGLAVNERGMIVEVTKPAVLKHEEHDPIEVPTGFYKRNVQREYQPKAPARAVMD